MKSTHYGILDWNPYFAAARRASQRGQLAEKAREAVQRFSCPMWPQGWVPHAVIMRPVIYDPAATFLQAAHYSPVHEVG